MRKVFTPKGLHNKAQGRERSERTLGSKRDAESTLKGSNKRLESLFHPFRVESWLGRDTQGALAALATLGCVIQRLRRKEIVHTLDAE